MRVEIRDDAIERPLAGRRVLVQHVDVATGGGTDDGVVVGAEARAEILRDHTDPGKALAYGFGGAVLGGVVEHDCLRVDVAERLEAREQQLSAVRVDDRDAEIGQRARPRATSASRAASTESSASWPSSHASRSCMPASNGISARKPSSSSARLVSAKQCRMSPARYLPTISASSSLSSPRPIVSAPATTELGTPVPTLTVRPSAPSCLSASAQQRVMSRTSMKSRVWRPSSNTSGARSFRSREEKIAATPV